MYYKVGYYTDSENFNPDKSLDDCFKVLDHLSRKGWYWQIVYHPSLRVYQVRFDYLKGAMVEYRIETKNRVLNKALKESLDKIESIVYT